MRLPCVEGFFDPATNTISYLVHDPGTRQAAVIDPLLDFNPASGRTTTTSIEALLARARSQDLGIVWVLETHAHADHLSAAQHVRAGSGAAIAIGERITEVQTTFADLLDLEADFARDGSQFDRLLSDGERLPLGNLDIEVMATPGHTPACVSYRMGDTVFVGDTLFMPDYGTARCDFPGGDAALLYQSIQRLLALPDTTRMFLCHDYKAPGRDRFAWETTVAAQRRGNVHVSNGVSEDDFVAMRRQRDANLDVPKLLYPSIQVNIRAGALPPADAQGRRFLKLPVV